MIVRSITATNEWTFGRGKNNYLQRNQAIIQMIKTRLQSFLGDCFFSVEEGIDWFNLLGAKNQVALELAISSVILNTEGVTGLVSLNLVLNSARRFTLTYSVNTIYTGLGNPNTVVDVGTSYLITEDGFILTTENGDQIEA